MCAFFSPEILQAGSLKELHVNLEGAVRAKRIHTLLPDCRNGCASKCVVHSSPLSTPRCLHSVY